MAVRFFDASCSGSLSSNELLFVILPDRHKVWFSWHAGAVNFGIRSATRAAPFGSR
jgi:hypothetical protein